jgi:hypothetical protein
MPPPLFFPPRPEIHVFCHHHSEPEARPDFDGWLDLQISPRGFHAELSELLAEAGRNCLLGVTTA